MRFIMELSPLNGSHPGTTYMPRFFSRRRASKRSTTRLGGFARGATQLEMLEPRTMLAANSVGSEFRVNTFTTEQQARPAVAMNGNGDSVVIWQNVFITGATADNFGGIFGQRYDRSGRPVGSNFRVNNTPAPGQNNPSVAMDDAGNFVAVWSGLAVQNDDHVGDDAGVLARRFDSSGNPLGDEFLVNTGNVNGLQASRARSVAMAGDGSFIISWLDQDQNLLLTQRYNNSGAPVGAPISIAPQGVFTIASIAMDDNGDFVIAWVLQDAGQNKEMFAQFFAADGTPRTTPFVVSTQDNSVETNSFDIAKDAQGKTTIVWMTAAKDGSANFLIVGRQFDALGNPLSGEFMVNETLFTTVNGNEFDYDLRVAMNDAGEFVISWRNADNRLRGRSFNADAVATSQIFAFNFATATVQPEHSIGIDDLGNFLVVWGAGTVTSQDIFARRALGDTLSTIGSFDRTTGQWYLRNQTTPGTTDFAVFPYGSQGWQPVVGDWNGDGQDTIGAVSPQGKWYLRNTNGSGNPDVPAFNFGRHDWIPISGDWDGDGFDSIGSYDRTAGGWYLRNSNTPGDPNIVPFNFGGQNFVPVVGDWNDSGVDTVGAYDISTGIWYLKNTFGSGVASITPFQFGAPGFTPVVGDWDHNGTDTVGVVSPDGTWYIRNTNSSGVPDIGPFPFGGNSFAPVAGDWDARSAALLAAGTTNPNDASVASISDNQLRPIVNEAIARWTSIDINAVDTLSNVDVRLADLDPGVLGRTAGHTVWIDRDAAGRGWFVDPTPRDDGEFTTTLAQGMLAADGVDNRFDLLSVVAHEMGHVLGHDHTHATAGHADVMDAELSVGVRRLPTAVVDRIMQED